MPRARNRTHNRLNPDFISEIEVIDLQSGRTLAVFDALNEAADFVDNRDDIDELGLILIDKSGYQVDLISASELKN